MWALQEYSKAQVGTGRGSGFWSTWWVKINGTTHYLWRAVDQHGDVLDILVQSRRNAKAAKRFFRKLLKGLR